MGPHRGRVTYDSQKKGDENRYLVVDRSIEGKSEVDGIPDEITRIDSENNKTEIILNNGVPEKVEKRNSNDEITETIDLSERNDVKVDLGSNPRGITVNTVPNLFEDL